MLILENEWSASAQHDCDVVVVGSGAAGISLAMELSRFGVKSVLLEGGGETYSDDSQDCYAGYSMDRKLPHGLIGSRLRFIGGSTNCWAGGCGELDTEDFFKRPWIKHSGWPIQKEHLKKYYELAAKFLDIDINRLRNPTDLAALPPLKGFELRSLEFTRRVRFALEFGDVLRRDPLIALFSGANLTSLNRTKDGDAVIEMTIKSFGGASSKVKGKAYVLACGGIENARILLNSGQEKFVAFGNRGDNVGRFFCDHPIAPCATVVGLQGDLKDMPYETRTFYRKQDQAQIAEPFYRLPFQLQEQFSTLNAAVQFHSQELELGSAEMAAWNLRNFIKDPHRSTVTAGEIMSIVKSPVQLFRAIMSRQWANDSRIAMRFQIEQNPNPDSRITLANETDKLGIKRVQLSWRFSEIERRTVDVAMAYAAACLQREEIGTLRLDRALDANKSELPLDLRGGQHHSGTTRMSESESGGVVDRDLKIFSSRNLFVCGSSVFPTNSWVNPTLTIVALSIRLAEHLAKRHLVFESVS